MNRKTVENLSSNLSQIQHMVSKIDITPIDRITISQHELDIVDKSRKNLFAWRGQFSPQLIELLLTHYAKRDTVILDPFAGSGTVLYEAARKSLSCFGSEINPAAYEMAKIAIFSNVNYSNRLNYLEKTKDIIKNQIAYDIDLFSYNRKGNTENVLLVDRIRNALIETSHDDLTHSILTNTLFRWSVRKQKGEVIKQLLDSFNQIEKIVKSLPYSENSCKVFNYDARKLPIDDGSVELVVTSPPYVNVFNYHQNYRQIMELDGWNLLDVAKSEMGSNRKNRGNRFLTLIQYSVDMLMALLEMKRVLSRNGKILIVIGRESRIRGISFENYKILSSLATIAGFILVSRRERQFVNRFGENIREDILELKPTQNFIDLPEVLAKNVALYLLKEAIPKAHGEVRDNMMSAISEADEVRASPLFIRQKNHVNLEHSNDKIIQFDNALT